MNDSILSQVIEQLTTLPTNLQQRVLDYVQMLKSSTQHGVPGKKLLRFAGAISLDDLEAMSHAIEAGCEQVDSNEW